MADHIEKFILRISKFADAIIKALEDYKISNEKNNLRK